MMNDALDKQHKSNADSGLSMKELFEQKRKAAEEKLKNAEESKTSGVSAQEKADRKARLLAQRDLLRK